MTQQKIVEDLFKMRQEDYQHNLMILMIEGEVFKAHFLHKMHQVQYQVCTGDPRIVCLLIHTSLKSKLAKWLSQRKEPYILKALDLRISKMTWKLV